LNITNTLKEDILSVKPAKECCRRAFLAGAILGGGSLPIEHGGLGLIIQSPSEELIERCVELAALLTKAEADIVKKDKELSLGQRIVYEFRLPSETAAPLLVKTGILQPPYTIKETVPEYTLSNLCCKKSFLRGIFCAAGSLLVSADKNANTKGYYLDIALSSEESARSVASLMSSMDIVPGVRTKKNNFSVYLKNSEKIADFCITIDAKKGYFALQNILASRSLRNDVNRKNNCEVANIDKTLSASAKQVSAIEAIKKSGLLSALDDVLRDTAEVRLANPDATLTELAKMLRYPTSKSGINHRLRKLIEIAKDTGGNYAEIEEDHPRERSES
jgi:DNA-binding protein WhiA